MLWYLSIVLFVPCIQRSIGALVPNCALATIIAWYLWIVSFLPYIDTLVPKYAPTLIDELCLKIGALLPNCALKPIMAWYLWIVSQFMHCFATIMAWYLWIVSFLPYIDTLVPNYAPTLIDMLCLKIGPLLSNCALTTIMASYLWIVSQRIEFCLKIGALLPNCALTTVMAWYLWIVSQFIELCLKIGALLPNCALTTITAWYLWIVSQFMNCFATIMLQQSCYLWIVSFLPYIDTLVPKYAPTLIDEFCLKIGALLPNCTLTTIMASY